MNRILTHILSAFFIGFLLWMCQSCSQSPYQVDALPYQAQEKGGWGLVTTEGKVIVPSGTFTQQPSAAVNGLFSLPDPDGFYRLYRIDHPERPICSQRFYRIGHFFEASTIAQEFPNSPILVLNKNGHILNDIGMSLHYDIVLMHNFNEGMALFATRKGKYGFMNLQGKVTIPPLYDQAFDFSEGKALVGNLNERGEMCYSLINKKGEVCNNIQISPVILDTQLSCGRLKYTHRTSHQCCYLNEKGATELYLPDSIQEAFRFKHEVALVQCPAGIGLINTKGELIIPARYEAGFIAGKDRVCLQNQAGWFLTDFHGHPLNGSSSFQHLTPFYPSGHALTKVENGYQWINREGEAAHSPVFFHITHDSTVLREVPQMLVRQTKVQEDASQQETQQAETTVPPTTETSPQYRATETQGDAGQTMPTQQTSQSLENPSCTLHGEEWKKITQQSPFYQEACKITSGKLTETDADNRRMILNYVEHLRTSYTTKDIDFLNQLFSEEALIIVGKVIRKAPQIEGEYLPREQIQYNIKSKQAYLGRLKVLFKQNKEIKLRFSDFKIMRHPTTPGLYGVSLRQRYQSDLYSDDGYLFLLWDFRDETQPLIHVRTWQPRMLNNHTPIAEEDIFNIRNFNLQ